MNTEANMRYWKSLAKRAAYTHKANTNYSRRRSDSSSLISEDAMEFQPTQKVEDSEKILGDTIEDLREELVQLCQIISQSIADKEQLQELYSQAQTQSSEWHQRAQLALQNQNENMACKAFSQKQKFSTAATEVRVKLDQATKKVATLKRNITTLEHKIAEIQTKQEILKVRAHAAKTGESINKAEHQDDTSGSGAKSTFERMEEKLMEIEAESEVIADIDGFTFGHPFITLEASSDVDSELAMLKAQIAKPPALEGTPTVPEALPNSEPVDTPQQGTSVDADLEELRKKLDQI